jgi:integrase/recombinase XerD
MTSVTIVLRKKTGSNPTSKHPLYLRVTKQRKAKYISLGINVQIDQWDQKKLRVKSSVDNSARINSLLAKKMSDAHKVALDHEARGHQITSIKLKEAIKGKVSNSLIQYMEGYLSDLKSANKTGTYDKVNATLLKLKYFLKSKDISFQEFDIHFLKGYERYLRDHLGNKPNTIHSNLKIFRKVFNDAMREDLIDINQNPFLKYKLKWEKTSKPYLEEHELMLMQNVELPQQNLLLFRDMYVFATYVGGIRISDLLQLTGDSYDGTHLTLNTQKTKETIRIQVPPKGIEIIDRYRSDNSGNKFLFPILSGSPENYSPFERFREISSATAYINKCLKQIAKKAGINKNISFHSSRHTWATRALRKGMRIEYVSKLMGHGSIKTTQIYTKIVNSELDQAMQIFN